LPHAFKIYEYFQYFKISIATLFTPIAASRAAQAARITESLLRPGCGLALTVALLLRPQPRMAFMTSHALCLIFTHSQEAFMISDTTKTAADVTEASAEHDLKSAAKAVKSSAKDVYDSVSDEVGHYADDANNRIRDLTQRAKGSLDEAK